jgi:hypothetical protein
VFTNSAAQANTNEGFYLLTANNVVLDTITTLTNGAAGVYVKNSLDVSVTHAYLNGDYVHIIGASTGGDYRYLSVAGGDLKIEGTADGVPSGNTLDHLCVQSVAGVPSNGVTFKNVNVTGTPNANVLTNSRIDMADSGNPALQVTSSSGNSIVAVYYPPAIFKTDPADVSAMFTPPLTARCR